MCQNKKIFTHTIREQYQSVISMLTQLKHNLVSNKQDTTSQQNLRQKCPTQHHIDDLNSHLASLKSLMHHIIEDEQTDDTANDHNLHVQVQPQYSISDLLYANAKQPSYFQPASSQLNNQTLCKQEYVEDYESRARGSYRSYTIQEKRQVLQMHKDGMNYAKISKLLLIPQKNIVRWCKTGIFRKQGAGRKIGDKQMEQNLKKFLMENYQTGLQITSRQIRQKAKKLTKKPGFKSSKGWLKNFIKRYQLNQQFVIV